MRMSYQHFVKLAKTSSGRDASKTAGKVSDKKGFLREFFLSPQFPRLLILAIGGASAFGYYLKNGMGNDAQKRKDEPLGDIKIENYNERLAKYATSMEVALQPNGKESLKGIRDVMEVYNQLGLNFNDISREQLIAFQEAEIIRKTKIALIAYKKRLLNMGIRGRYHTAVTDKGTAVTNESAVNPAAINRLTPEEEKTLTALAINVENVELEFWSSILTASTPEQRRKLALQASNSSNSEGRTLVHHCFANMSSYLSPYQRPHVFVLKFDGKIHGILFPPSLSATAP
jgi:hypothetical protein